jgi:hypothetical protein
VSKRSILMQSIPNSGSTWLGQLVVDTLGLSHFEGLEYFNPVRNERHEQTLSGFGLETIEHYHNITTDGADLDDAIASTWAREHYEFTKEVWSPMKTALFARHFQVVVLLRPTYGRYGTFPPSRQRALGFYEHAYHALRDAKMPVAEEVRTRARAEAAHRFLLEQLHQQVDNMSGVTALHYEILAAGTLSQLVTEFSASFPADADRLAAAVFTSRKALVKGEG